jgi:hypothetical protein
VTRILLVEDGLQHASYFRQLYADVDVCRDVRQLNRAIEAGGEWAAAFIDFDLSGVSGEPQPTGLSALRLLMQSRPRTRRIVYTTLGENGRILYAVAAYRWLDTAIILDKNSDDERQFLDAANPRAANPTPSAWQAKLSDHAYLIDYLFANHNWLALWRIWSYYNGSIRAVAAHLPPKTGIVPNSVREFSVEATNAMTNFRHAFYGPRPTTYERGEPNRRARATPLVAFADANDKFFNAPDLQEVLYFAKPWDRIRRR